MIKNSLILTAVVLSLILAPGCGKKTTPPPENETDGGGAANGSGAASGGAKVKLHCQREFFPAGIFFVGLSG